jgi:DNA-binding response OmpR family regulator
MTTPRVLIVEDDDAVLMMLREGLERDGFEVVTASNVRDALQHIAAEKFDVLLSDLHLPLAGDGFTLVSAMRHTHPDALTVVLSGYPALEEAMSAILSQADEIFTKPVRIGPLKELIRERLTNPQAIKRPKSESIASILERESETTIQNWLVAVEQDEELTCVPLSRLERTGHLPKLVRDLVLRLQLDSGFPGPVSMAAREHGRLRFQQGYTAAMVVEESRILQVSIFSTLQRNLAGVNFSRLLLDVVTIADEVDSQLKQAMMSYVPPAVVKSQSGGIGWIGSIRVS